MVKKWLSKNRKKRPPLRVQTDQAVVMTGFPRRGARFTVQSKRVPGLSPGITSRIEAAWPSDDEEVVGRQCELLRQGRELHGGFRAVAVLIVEQRASFLVIDDPIRRIMSLVADPERLAGE